ncbi:MAG: hypothetical protein BWX88_03616 [Planctomycetes bacterium ADurb.Bin126]|nr:MAG: hypothetical protein BWX88_03616 [Planctomycetes bacterium ADurb.Bin126]
MLASSAAEMRTSYAVDVRPASTSWMKAATLLSTTLWATPTPIDSDTPTSPTEAATATAPVKALIFDVSSAVRLTLSASTPLSSLSPLTYACTRVAMRFPALAPAPATATPTSPPDSATEPEKTVASMVCSEKASSVRAPAASALESRMYACTPTGSEIRLVRRHWDESE